MKMSKSYQSGLPEKNMTHRRRVLCLIPIVCTAPVRNQIAVDGHAFFRYIFYEKIPFALTMRSGFHFSRYLFLLIHHPKWVERNILAAFNLCIYMAGTLLAKFKAKPSSLPVRASLFISSV